MKWPLRGIRPRGWRARELVDLSWKACVVGAIAGLGAIGFRGMIALLHNLAFAGRLSLHYDANVHTAPSVWGALIIGVPVVGALVVAFVVHHYAPEAKGHGVPEVMEAIYYRAGRIRPIVAVVKALASSISIATGGSVGREGPIAQIGSAFGATLGQWLKLPTWQRSTLIAAGAGGGIAATFNTPIGGVFFAVELLLVEVNARTLFPVSLSVAIATLVGRAAFGAKPSFIVSPQAAEHILIGPSALMVLLVFGVVLGFAAALFSRSIYWAEDFFDAIPGGYVLRHALGMLVVGLLIYLMLRTTGHYYVQGVGYATLQDVIDGALQSPWLLLALFGAKLLATSVTLGSGASGGVFSPALFLGGCIGGAFAGLVGWLFPSLELRPLVFAVAGMAGLAGASMGAALTAVTMLFEMTRSYEIVIPMIVTVAAAYAARRVLLRESIYTFKLTRRGHHVPQALLTEFPLVQSVAAVSEHRVAWVEPTDDLRALVSRESDAQFFIVEEDGVVQEIIPRPALQDALLREHPRTLSSLGESFIWIDPQTSLREGMARLKAEGVAIGLVRSSDGTLSVFTLHCLSHALDRTLALVEL